MSEHVMQWGNETKSETKEIRGLLREPGKPGVDIVIRGAKGKLDRAWRWKFEVCGPGALYAYSPYSYATPKNAQTAAVIMANALLAVAAEVERI